MGGKENPRLSFITPTVIAGDKSLVSVIAHELAHSWSGNLVTNATWRDVWLNEGFTVFLESRIMTAVYGEQRASMEAVLGLQSLRDEMATLAPADQVLAIDLRDRDPDLAFSDRALQKGRLFLKLPRGEVRHASASMPSCTATSITSHSRASPPNNSTTTCWRTCWTASPAS